MEKAVPMAGMLPSTRRKSGFLGGGAARSRPVAANKPPSFFKSTCLSLQDTGRPVFWLLSVAKFGRRLRFERGLGSTAQLDRIQEAMVVDMGVDSLLPVEEDLNTCYSPVQEYGEENLVMWDVGGSVNA